MHHIPLSIPLLGLKMADVAKATSAVDAPTQKTRPEKPNQAKYEADLAAAQKEHAANMEKYVRLLFVACFRMQKPVELP